LPDMRFAPPNPLRIADRASGLNAPTVRGYNERLVLSLLLQGKNISRLEIGEKTGLSAQTVSVIVRSLEQEGLVSKGEAQRGRVGPPTIPLFLNPEGAFSVGLSLGERMIDVVLIDFVGQVRHHTAHHYPALPERSQDLIDKIEEALTALPASSRARVAGIGLAVPDDARASPNLRDIIANAQGQIEDRLNLSVYIQNDVTAAAGGESLFGVARSFSDFLFVYLGSRLHSRVILNYQIHSGKFDHGQAVGLLKLQEGLEQCHLTLDDLASGAPPGAAIDDVYTAWTSSCCREIISSVRLLLNFVNFKSVVISSHAPRAIGLALCAQLSDELREVDFLLGANSIAPKAVGAASLPYHSRFMVQ
jgi:biotin operon repressor